MARVGLYLLSLYIAVCCLAIVTCKAPSRKVLANKLESLKNDFQVFKSEVKAFETKTLLQFAEREESMREDFDEKLALMDKTLGAKILTNMDKINTRLEKLIAEQEEMKRKVVFVHDHFDMYVEILKLHNVSIQDRVKSHENSSCGDTSKCKGVGEAVDSGQTSTSQTDVIETTSTSSPTSTSRTSSSSSTSSSTASSSSSSPDSASKGISATRAPSVPRNRILMSKYFKDSNYFKQFHFDTGKTDTYSHLRGNNVLALTYDPTKRRVIYTRDSPSGIFATPLDGKGVTTLLRKVGSEGLFVEEKRKLLYFTTFKPNNTISRMTTSGEDYHIIASLYNKGFVSPRALTVDSEREIIYYNFRGRPQSMDFNGNNRESYSVTNYGSYACGLDVFTNTLYYNDDKWIVKRDLTTGNTTILQTLREATRNIIWYDNTLYMSGWDYGGIYVINLEKNEMYQPVGGLPFYDHVIALLP